MAHIVHYFGGDLAILASSCHYKVLCAALQDLEACKRGFHISTSHSRLVSILLAQTGEGIKECELVRWTVKVQRSP